MRLGNFFFSMGLFAKLITAGESALAAAVEKLEDITIEGSSIETGIEHRKTLLEDQELRKRLRSNLGATLENEMGLSNASFGPGVGIPVIRGLTGSRILVTQGGLANHDVSSMGPDHALTVEPLLSEGIRIEKGPSTIRYGGTALGGVVDVLDNRVPEYKPDNPLKLQGEYRYDSNSREHTGLIKADGVIGDHFVLHADGLKRSRELTEIPGYAMDTEAIFEQFGLNVTGNTRGFIGNSQAETETGALGVSFVDESNGFLGVAVSAYNTNYGIPPGGHPSHTHNNVPVPENGEQVRIDLHNLRYTLKGEWYADLAMLDSLRLHAAIVDYRHDELEGALVSTHFSNFTQELRFEADHRLGDYLDGSLGLQISDQDFAASGGEDFIPETRIDRLAAYWIQRLNWQAVTFEGGVRVASQANRPQQTTRVIGGLVSASLPEKLDYEALSFSLSARYELTEASSVAIHWQRAERAPAVQELLSLGPHLATRSFDVGNIGMQLERADALELTFNYHDDSFKAYLNLFKNDIDNFIYQENLGFFFDIDEQLFRIRCVRLEQCVPVLGYQQQNARFWGYEADVGYSFDFWLHNRITVGLFSDYTRGYFVTEGAGDVPRLPPRRAGVYLQAQHNRWHGEIRWTHAWQQDRPGNNETATEGYELLNASLEFHPFASAADDVRIFLNVRNMLDEEIRHSVSFLRAFAPQAGRSFDVGIALTY